MNDYSELTIDDLRQGNGSLSVDRPVSPDRPIMLGNYKFGAVTPGLNFAYASCIAQSNVTLSEPSRSDAAFMLCLRGKRSFNIDRHSDIALTAGKLGSIVYPPGTPLHEEWAFGQTAETISLELSRKFFDNLGADGDGDIAQAYKVLRNSHAQSIDATPTLMQLARLIRQSATAGPFETLKQRGLALAFLAEAAAAVTGAPEKPRCPSTSPRLASIREKLDAEFATDPDLSSLAKEASLSERQFRRLFKAEFGESISDYLRSRRLEYAHTLLEEGAASISEIGYRCGYANAANFTNAFKKRFGYTPGVVHAL